jgi:hypothetical protein
MRNLAIIVPFLAATLYSDGPPAKQPQATMKAASLEAHEGVTISARPWTDAALQSEISKEVSACRRNCGHRNDHPQ